MKRALTHVRYTDENGDIQLVRLGSLVPDDHPAVTQGHFEDGGPHFGTVLHDITNDEVVQSPGPDPHAREFEGLQPDSIVEFVPGELMVSGLPWLYMLPSWLVGILIGLLIGLAL